MDLSPEIERIYQTTPLEKGNHLNADEGRCAMEMVALLAGEKHSDHPVCASPVITRFVIAINDRLPDADRQRIKPFIPAMIGTRDGHDRDRMWFLVTQAVTVFTPLALRAAGKDEWAKTLEAIGPIATAAQAIVARDKCRAAAAYAADVYAAADAAAYAAAYAADADASRRKALGIREKMVTAIMDTIDRLTQIGKMDAQPQAQVCDAAPILVPAE